MSAISIQKHFRRQSLNIELLKMGHPRPLFHLFSSFQANITIFTTNKCEKNVRPVNGTGVQTTTRGT